MISFLEFSEETIFRIMQIMRHQSILSLCNANRKFMRHLGAPCFESCHILAKMSKEERTALAATCLFYTML